MALTVQNAAASLLTSSRKYDHITPVLKELYWFPVRYGIHFKILLLNFKALNGMAPVYISNLLNVRKRTRYSRRSISGTILLHPAGKMKKNLLVIDLLGPVYTGPDKFLHGQKLARFHFAFTRDWQNWTNI